LIGAAPISIYPLGTAKGEEMIIAHGIDLVDIASTERLLAEPSNQFLARCFTLQEQSDVGEGHEQAARLSGRFAVKEAVLKALGTGFGNSVGFRDVEVVLLTSGAPTIVLHGEAAQLAEGLGISRWLVSTSHEGNIAIASVIALGD
jgi:holo-[acyl-carrier protein] synthase